MQSACVLCSHGCALDIGVRDGTIVGVWGRGVDRVNHGRLGPKGLCGWDAGDDAGHDSRPRAANELTMTIWDPVSKQPQLTTAAVKVEKIG